MPGFEALYKQTITLFNRKDRDGYTFWYPFVIEKVHLIMDKSIIIASYGEQSQDNAQVHIQYTPSAEGAVVGGRIYMLPKMWQREGVPGENFTLAYGDNFDFIMEGAWEESEEVDDLDYKNGFYNFMNKSYDNVFAVTTVAKFNLIPHFEIGAR